MAAARKLADGFERRRDVAAAFPVREQKVAWLGHCRSPFDLKFVNPAIGARIRPFMIAVEAATLRPKSRRNSFQT